jgi:hypothetical protein
MQQINPTPQQLTLIKLRISQSICFTHICKELGISRTVGSRWFKANGLFAFSSQSIQPCILNAKEAAEFRTYYKTSPTRQAILSKYRITTAKLCGWLEQLNLEMPKREMVAPTKICNLNGLNYPQAAPLSRAIRADEAGEPRVSIAARYRQEQQGNIALNPYRY